MSLCLGVLVEVEVEKGRSHVVREAPVEYLVSTFVIFVYLAFLSFFKSLPLLTSVLLPLFLGQQRLVLSSLLLRVKGKPTGVGCMDSTYCFAWVYVNFIVG